MPSSDGKTHVIAISGAGQSYHLATCARSLPFRSPGQQPRFTGHRHPGGHSLRSRHSRAAASAPASLPSLAVPLRVRLGRAPCRMRRIDPLGARPLPERPPGRREPPAAPCARGRNHCQWVYGTLHEVTPLNAIQLVLLGLLTLVIGVPAIVLALLLPGKALKGKLFLVVSKTYARIALWLFRIQVVGRGLANIDPGKPYIFMSNHASHADSPALALVISHPLYWVFKKELARIPVFCWVLLPSRHIIF